MERREVGKTGHAEGKSTSYRHGMSIRVMTRRRRRGIERRRATQRLK
jgi:hypothetical protein